MSSQQPSANPVTALIAELSRLPGIGEKTATRLAYYVLKTERTQVEALAQALLSAKTKVRLCDNCLNFTEQSKCSICSDVKRQTGKVCVVEKPADIMAIENSHRFFGQYHVLHGLLSPLDGVGPSQLHIKELIARAERGEVQEIILALSSSVEGDATGVYLTKLLKPLGITVSKIAHGIPVGGVLEYMDRQTIGRAIENRVASQT
jgi:recombination protein RecR